MSGLIPPARLWVERTFGTSRSPRMERRREAQAKRRQEAAQREADRQERELYRRRQMGETKYAMEWLGNLTGDGEPVPATEVQRLAAEAGIVPRTLQRAKKKLGIASVKRGTSWYWVGPRRSTS